MGTRLGGEPGYRTTHVSRTPREILHHWKHLGRKVSSGWLLRIGLLLGQFWLCSGPCDPGQWDRRLLSWQVGYEHNELSCRPGNRQGVFGGKLTTVLSLMVRSDKRILRVIGCGCEGIASPHTEKDLRDPDPRAQGPGTRPGTPEVLCLPRQDPCSPRLQVSEESDRHESVPTSAREQAKPGQQGQRTLQGQWAQGGHNDSESHVLGQLFGRFLRPSCLFCAFLFVRRSCCCLSLYISISIPDPAPLQPREDRHSWHQALSLVSLSLSPPLPI